MKEVFGARILNIMNAQEFIYSVLAMGNVI